MTNPTMDYLDLTKIEQWTLVLGIDDQSFRGRARFMRAVDEHRALGRLRHPVGTGTGSWEGKISHCFVMAETDWHNLPRGVRDYAANQFAFLRLMPGKRTVACDLVSHRGRVRSQAGQLWEVSLGSLHCCEGYTLIGNRAYVAADAVPSGAINVRPSILLEAGARTPANPTEHIFLHAVARHRASFDSHGFNTVSYPWQLADAVDGGARRP